MSPPSPAMRRLCRSFDGGVAEVGRLSDPDLHLRVMFAFTGHGPVDPAEPAALTASEATVAAAITARLRSGWFARESWGSPQAWYRQDANPLARAADRFTAWNSKPLGAVWTSSFLSDGSCAWTYREHGEFGHDRVLHALAFDVAALDVHVIDSPSDYRDLVERFPAPGAEVDWNAVAEHHDAVRLTVHGLLTTQDVPVRTRVGTAHLVHWDSECTAWLKTPAWTPRPA